MRLGQVRVHEEINGQWKDLGLYLKTPEQVRNMVANSTNKMMVVDYNRNYYRNF